MKFADALTRLVTRHGKAVVVGVAALLALSFWPLSRVQLSTDIFELIPQDLSVLQAFRTFTEKFGQGNDLIIAIEPTAGQNEAATDAFIESFAASLKATSGVRTVRYRFEVNSDPAMWLPMLPRLTPWLNTEDWAEVEKRLQPAAIAERARRLRVALASAP